MRFAPSLLLVLAAACGGGDDADTGTFSVSWSLGDPAATTAPTCDSYKVSDVVVTATDMATGNTKMVSSPCAAGMVATPKLDLGSYKVTLAAMGTFGDEAGTKDVTGMIAMANQVVTLAPVVITVGAPTSKAHATWTLKQNGTTATCGAFGANAGIAVHITPMGGAVQTDIWDCTETNAVVDVPYGPFTAQLDLLHADNTLIAGSQVVNVDAGRGVIQVAATIDAN